MEIKLWERLTRERVYLDQTACQLEIDAIEVERFYLPISDYLIKRCQKAGRVVVAVAGPPGCGKSAFAATLGLVINAIVDQEVSIVVGLDGWHFPNSYLEGHSVDREGKKVPLRSIKGDPQTYDVTAIAGFLADIHDAHQDVHFPVYSRSIHNPLAAAGVIKPCHSYVILEGNYWLLDHTPWRDFRRRVDVSIFLSAEKTSLAQGLHERHRRGGKSPEMAQRHIDQVDLPNITLVLEHSIKADVEVRKLDGRRIREVVWVSPIGPNYHTESL